MAIVLSILGVAFAAFCVWLAVRVVNRRERWAKWTLAASIFGMPLLYLLSFGPACWWIATTIEEVPGGPTVGGNAAYVSRVYWPIGWAVEGYPFLKPMFAGYSHLFGRRTAVLLPTRARGAEGTILWLQRR